jgi:hypothetical protein
MSNVASYKREVNNHEATLDIKAELLGLTDIVALLKIDGKKYWCPLACIEDALAQRQVGKVIAIEVSYRKAREWGLV